MNTLYSAVVIKLTTADINWQLTTRTWFVDIREDLTHHLSLLQPPSPSFSLSLYCNKEYDIRLEKSKSLYRREHPVYCMDFTICDMPGRWGLHFPPASHHRRDW